MTGPIADGWQRIVNGALGGDPRAALIIEGERAKMEALALYAGRPLRKRANPRLVAEFYALLTGGTPPARWWPEATGRPMERSPILRRLVNRV